MLTVWEAIKMRRSIRRFAPKEIPDKIIEQMLEAARLAPSAINRQPWRFLVVKDKQLRKELRHICLEQRFIEEAPVVFVCFGDLERYSLEARRKIGSELVQAIGAELSGLFADPTYQDYFESQPVPPREELLTPMTADTFIAIEHIVLMATALGLGCCWVGGFTDAIESEINRLFHLPDTLVPVAVLPIGYPAQQVPPPRPRLSLNEILLKPQIQNSGKQSTEI